MIDEENPYFSLSAATADIDLYAFMRELTLSGQSRQRHDQSEWRTFIQKTQSTLRFLAEETGGFAVVNDNDFAAAFKRDRQRDQRLLRDRVLLEQPRPAAAGAAVSGR